MKKDKKEEAIKLRKEGLSLNKISEELKVAKSSVSLWVRNVELSEQQIEYLEKKGHNHESLLYKNNEIEKRNSRRTLAGKMYARRSRDLRCRDKRAAVQYSECRAAEIWRRAYKDCRRYRLGFTER